MGDTAAFIIEVTNELSEIELVHFGDRLKSAIIERDTRAIRELIDDTLHGRFLEASG
jgi:hypothetical protein